MTNITDTISGTRNVTLFYSTDPLPPRRFASINMTRISGDETAGSYAAQIPKQSNNTDVYYFTRIVDGKGNSYEMSFTEREPNHYRVVVFPSEFRIEYLGIRDIDNTALSADIEVAFRIYWPFGENQLKSVTVQFQNQFWDFQSVELPLSTEKYVYFLRTVLKGVTLIGDATLYPFDRYYLDLNFTFGPETDLVSFSQQSVCFNDYSDYYVWDLNCGNVTDVGGYGSGISVRIDLNRRIENAFYSILPLVFGFFVLGATMMMNSGNGLRHRLAVYLALFVFVFTFAFTVNRFVPLRASGVTLVEIALISLGAYVGIYMVSSIAGNFLMKLDSVHEAAWNVIADGIGIFGVLYLFFNLVLVRTPWTTRSLFTVMSATSSTLPDLRSLMICGLVYGFVLRTITLETGKGRPTRYLSKIVKLAGFARRNSASIVGAFAGFVGVLIVSTTSTPPSQLTTYATLLFLIPLGLALCLATFRRKIERYYTGQRYRDPRVGVITVSGMSDEDLRNSPLLRDNSYLPRHWVEGLASQGLQKAQTVSVESMAQGFDILINPFGERYPESDTSNMRTLKQIKQFVEEGGIFVNTHGLAFFYMYNHITLTEGLTGSYAQSYAGGVPKWKDEEYTGRLRDVYSPPVILEPEVNPDASSLLDTWLLRNLGVRTTVGHETEREVASARNDFPDILQQGQKVREFRAVERCESSDATLFPIFGCRYKYSESGRSHECYPVAAVRYGLGYFLICGMMLRDECHKRLIEMTTVRLARILAQQGELPTGS